MWSADWLIMQAKISKPSNNWWQWLPWQPKNPPANIATWQQDTYQLRYRIHSYDLFVIKEIWEQNEYFLDVINPNVPGVILDIGAHIGAFTLKIKSLYPEKAVFAFEPETANFQLLKQNITNNNLAFITPLQMAVSKETGSIPFFVDLNHTAGHRTTFTTQEPHQQVSAVALSDFINQYNLEQIALLKIDCEGGEYDILMHLATEHWQRIIYLAFEYHDSTEYCYEDLLQHLVVNGFKLLAHKDGYSAGQGTALFVNRNWK
jgi:FkbM family methyltransferase